jgi:hypothetical protein
LTISQYALPSWLTLALGERVEPYLLWTDTKRFILSREGEDDQIFTDVEEAYDSVEEPALKMDRSLMNDYGFYLVPNGSNPNGNTRMLMSRTDDDSLWGLEEDLFIFLEEINTRYLSEPENFMASYSFLNMHPAFWTRAHPDEPIDRQVWITGNAISKMHIAPHEHNTGHLFIVEFGEAAGPDYVNTYVDDDLTDQAPTYEQAVIDAAKKVAGNFWPTGERKTELPSADFNSELRRLQNLHVRNTAEHVALEDPYL